MTSQRSLLAALLCLSIGADAQAGQGALPDGAQAARSSVRTTPHLEQRLEEARVLIAGDAASREAALPLLTSVIDDARAAPQPMVGAEALLTRGELRLNLGRDEPAALDDLERAVTLFTQHEALGRAARASTLAGMVLRRLGRLDDADAAHRRALAWYEQVGDRAGLGAVYHNLGALLFSRSRLDEAEAHYTTSIRIRREIGETAATAGTLNNLATVYGERGDLDKAIASHLDAREVALASGSRFDLAYATLGLGSQSYVLGEWQQAMEYLVEAAAHFDALGDRSGLAFAQHTLGVVYLTLGHDTDAVTVLEAVVPLRTHDPARLGTTLQSLANAYRAGGDADKARAALLRALELKRQASDLCGEAATLRSLAALELPLGRHEEALRHATAARPIAERANVPDGVALTLALMSRATGSRPDAALAADLHRAATSAETRRAPRTEAVLRAELARVALNEGNLESAREHVAVATSRVERLRAGVASLDLRATYLASQTDLLDLEVEILLRSHARAPDAGHDRAAFLAAERARGRRLLDALGDAALPHAGDSPTRARELALERDVSVAAIALERGARGPAAEMPRLQADLDARLLALRQFRADARAQLPWRRETPPPDLARLQRDLPADTTVLSYWLGSARAAVWAVTPSAVTLVELGPADAVRDAVRDVYPTLADGTGTGVATLQRAAALLLHPVDAHLTTRRIAVVVDGTLEYVPFAALPMAAGAAPLASRHEILRLPTATGWDASPRRPPTSLQHSLTDSNRPPTSAPAPRVVVVADPVFSATDGRVSPAADTQVDTTDASAMRAPAHAATGQRSTFLTTTPARLPFSRVEADAIAVLAPGATVLTDFEASKARVSSLPLADVDVLHLATHADQHTMRADLSGVVLSLVDAHGQAVDGRMRLHEIVSLPLDGQTVVLSACQTMIGPDLRGDGLQGLARGFLQAGAGAVVASLWNVDDRATMVLMRHFYEALIRDGSPPAEALARAQRAMQADARWHAPQYWAGFVVLGLPG